MNKIIAFLGDEELKPTTYLNEGKRVGPTRYLLAALAQHFYPGYALRLLCTPEAERRHLMDLRRELGDEAARRLCIIPVQKIATESDLWDVFQVIQGQVEDGDDIVVDITHSFRALPFLAFLALAYLRVIRKFTIAAIIYAPYAQYEKSEVYNIREFVDLLDWIIAANLFTETGFAAPIANLLQGHGWGSSKAKPAELERVTAALRLARPDEARQAAYALAQSLANIESDAPRSQLRPFEALLDRIKAEFAQIAPAMPDPDDLQQELEQELAFVSWNLERGQFLSAVTVAREWLLSLACWHAGWTDRVKDYDRTGRELEIPRWRSNEREPRKGVPSEPRDTLYRLMMLIEQEPDKRHVWVASQRDKAANSLWLHLWDTRSDYAQLLGHTWKEVSTLRNDLDHAGMIFAREPLSLDVLVPRVKEIPRLLEEVYLKSGASTTD